jgi:hypothetical protein
MIRVTIGGELVRKVDCVFYSRCLAAAAMDNNRRFVCLRCKEYTPEQLSNREAWEEELACASLFIQIFPELGDTTADVTGHQGLYDLLKVAEKIPS